MNSRLIDKWNTNEELKRYLSQEYLSLQHTLAEDQELLFRYMCLIRFDMIFYEYFAARGYFAASGMENTEEEAAMMDEMSKYKVKVEADTKLENILEEEPVLAIVRRQLFEAAYAEGKLTWTLKRRKIGVARQRMYYFLSDYTTDALKPHQSFDDWVASSSPLQQGRKRLRDFSNVGQADGQNTPLADKETPESATKPHISLSDHESHSKSSSQNETANTEVAAAVPSQHPSPINHGIPFRRITEWNENHVKLVHSCVCRGRKYPSVEKVRQEFLTQFNISLPWSVAHHLMWRYGLFKLVKDQQQMNRDFLEAFIHAEKVSAVDKAHPQEVKNYMEAKSQLVDDAYLTGGRTFLQTTRRIFGKLTEPNSNFRLVGRRKDGLSKEGAYILKSRHIVNGEVQFLYEPDTTSLEPSPESQSTIQQAESPMKTLRTAPNNTRSSVDESSMNPPKQYGKAIDESIREGTTGSRFGGEQATTSGGDSKPINPIPRSEVPNNAHNMLAAFFPIDTSTTEDFMFKSNPVNPDAPNSVAEVKIESSINDELPCANGHDNIIDLNAPQSQTEYKQSGVNNSDLAPSVHHSPPKTGVQTLRTPSITDSRSLQHVSSSIRNHASPAQMSDKPASQDNSSKAQQEHTPVKDREVTEKPLPSSRPLTPEANFSLSPRAVFASEIAIESGLDVVSVIVAREVAAAVVVRLLHLHVTAAAVAQKLFFVDQLAIVATAAIEHAGWTPSVAAADPAGRAVAAVLVAVAVAVVVAAAVAVSTKPVAE